MDPQVPKVSVCLITYKHELYIEQAIESILMQKVNFAWEIIIADDCSPDGTRDIILKYQKLYPELIRTVFQQENVGPGKNYVDLINAARGTYIAYIEGDDYWSDEYKLQKQFDFMQVHPDFSLCYHKIKWIYAYEAPHDADAESNAADPPVSTIYDVLKKGWFIRSCSMFFVNFRLPAGFADLFIGDYPLHVLLADKGRIGFLNECMGIYRINDQGLSETILTSADVISLRKNVKDQIFMLKYLDRQTGFKYKNYLNSKIVDELYRLLSFTFKASKVVFLSELRNAIASNGVKFIAAGFIKKGFSKLKMIKN
ncbi:glycosyltransferase family 2 protein [Agriterribacter sp.]|uniref:glycosyltransferase family 2 protein n=1 Tax=Agriterribacter sp. TaxID=2821509 RepID=UPI002B644AA5|nr:glycosyltransferase [Agriterribacter sp.]HTN06104.1 glycosyltransferase [Agriterribacter sp.]